MKVQLFINLRRKLLISPNKLILKYFPIKVKQVIKNVKIDTVLSQFLTFKTKINEINLFIKLIFKKTVPTNIVNYKFK